MFAGECRTVLSAEMEMAFARPSTQYEEALRNKGHVLVNATMELGQPSSRTAIIGEMRSYYEALRPDTDEEAARKAQWLDRIRDKVTESDVINFLLYRELSHPTLTYAKYPLGTSYSSVIRRAGSLEFRGPGVHQSGWYDAEGVSEARMAPTSEDTFDYHRFTLLRRISEIAAQEGRRTYLAPPHINGSVYMGQTPLLGDMSNLTPYKAVVAGLDRIYGEGGLIDPHLYPSMYRVIGISSLRQQVRVMPGRFEARIAKEYGAPDYTNGRRFLNAGLRYGSQYATEEEIARVQMTNMLRAIPGIGYDKAADTVILRAIETCATLTNCTDEEQRFRLIVDGGYYIKAIDALTGRTNEWPEESNVTKMFFTHGVELGSDGTLQTNERLLANVLRRCPNEHQITIDDIPVMNYKLGRIKVIPTEQIYHVVREPKDGDFLTALRSASALPTVAPEEYADLVTELKDKY